MKKIVFSALILLSFLSCNQENKPADVDMGNQNKVVEAIMNRRSIRAYKPEQIAQNQLDTILQCGINAPSALNKQSWQVRVVRNADLLSRINARFVEDGKGKTLEGSAARTQEPGFSVFHGAPTLIIVAKDKSNAASAVDCGLLAQNILLSAQSMNIGTCVIGSVAAILSEKRSKDFLAEMEIPDTHEVVFGIAIGYKDQMPDPKPREVNRAKYIK